MSDKFKQIEALKEECTEGGEGPQFPFDNDKHTLKIHIAQVFSFRLLIFLGLDFHPLFPLFRNISLFAHHALLL